MRTTAKALAPALAMLPLCPALAAELSDMLGQWRWDKFTVEVSECAEDKLCAKVIAGPKNVGMEIFASTLTSKDGDWFGDIVDPENKTTYKTRLRQISADVWQLDGCTSSRVCLSGKFVRVK